jgi:hypothetical protein
VTFSYLVYGLGIESYTAIVGLKPVQHLPQKDLSFETGPKPEWVKNALEMSGRVLVQRPGGEGLDPTFVLTERGGGEYCELTYADGTIFVVSERGDRVWGSVPSPYTEEDLAAYFLGPILGFVLRHRRVTCLHASGVELHGRGVLFSGDAGDGKSTTAGALALRGIPVLADDIMPLELTDNEIWVSRGYPRIWLWPESVEKLVGNADGLPSITPTWDKRFLPLDGVLGKFAAERRPLGVVYIFGARTETNSPRIEEVAPKDALMELVRKTYMNWLLDRQRRGEEFDELSKVVQRVPVRRIVAHQDAERIPELCDLILSDVAKVLSVRV